MTRKEEIEFAWFLKAVQSNHRYDEKSFKEAAKWADKTMIDKACEWIQKEVLEDYEGVIWSDIVKDFRKAMEE